MHQWVYRRLLWLLLPYILTLHTVELDDDHHKYFLFTFHNGNWKKNYDKHMILFYLIDQMLLFYCDFAGIYYLWLLQMAKKMEFLVPRNRGKPQCGNNTNWYVLYVSVRKCFYDFLCHFFCKRIIPYIEFIRIFWFCSVCNNFNGNVDWWTRRASIHSWQTKYIWFHWFNIGHPSIDDRYYLLLFHLYFTEIFNQIIYRYFRWKSTRYANDTRFIDSWNVIFIRFVEFSTIECCHLPTTTTIVGSIGIEYVSTGCTGTRYTRSSCRSMWILWILEYKNMRFWALENYSIPHVHSIYYFFYLYCLWNFIQNFGYFCLCVLSRIFVVIGNS